MSFSIKITGMLQRTVSIEMEKPMTTRILGGAVFVYFVIAFEVVVMISPFAAFFYAAFNPFLLALAEHPATRWLTAFFLPHMVLHPSLFLQIVRVLGSILFLLGLTVFLACALQVYFMKLTRRGVCLRGLYSYIRHPQYFGLAMTGAGLAILWPRILVIALWALMLVLYYWLALDEERRMLQQHDPDYRLYMDKTGRFLPKRFEDTIARYLFPKRPKARAFAAVALLAALSMVVSFSLRLYTVSSLPLWVQGPVTVLPILPSDAAMVDHRMANLLSLPEVTERLSASDHYLVYFMKPNYIMQGMIGDTGGDWRLHQQHHTYSLIVDWIFHPFRHLESGHSGMQHSDMGGRMIAHAMESDRSPTVRRLIFVRLDNQTVSRAPGEAFGINVIRTPVFVVDVDVHSLRLESVQDLPQQTGWWRVPTPSF